MSDFATCCVLSFNRPGFLGEALMTLLENAGAPLELIIHDDGSTPDPDPQQQNIYELLDEFQGHATIITNPPGHNQGQGIALNRMFSMAKGDPIIKLDQDLVFEPNWLARAQRVLSENRMASAQGFEPRIGLLGLLHYWHDPVDSRKTFRAQHTGWQEHTHILGSGFALRRETWDALGPFEEHSDAFAEDWAMQMKVTESERWACGLPTDDLVVNQGMGPGPSTVVIPDADAAGGIRVQSIHKEPLIIRG